MSAMNVRCLLVPVSGGKILLPSALVAEVFTYRRPDEPRNEPVWLTGILTWRKQNIPLFSIEKLLSIEEREAKSAQRIIVFYGVHRPDQMPFYAMTAKGMPHSVNIAPETLTSPKQVKRPGITASAVLNEKTVWLPDVEYLENLLAEHML